MALALCWDRSPADWIVASDLPWAQLVTFGPSGFAAYARLRFLPDPAYQGQSENDADPDAAPCATDQWRALFEQLGARTRTPDDCYFCLWEGWPFPRSVLHAPKVSVPPHPRVPYRSYFLFRGLLSDAGAWGEPKIWPGDPPPFEAAFVWPADRAWCVANDVDPHWAGIGADATLIDRMVADPSLDIVAADPGEAQPAYM
jgi:hypothetical protein